MDEYKSLKKMRLKNEKSGTKKYILRFLSQVMLSIILLLVSLIVTKNHVFKEKIYRYVYQDNLSFKELENYYKKYFGGIILDSPSKKEDSQTVSSEVMECQIQEEIEGGVRLVFQDNKIVTALESGLVLFIGQKEGFGNTLILEQTDGVEAWYVGLTDVDYKIYDYIEKNKILGNVKENTLDLYFKRKGEVVSYQEYIS